MRRANRGAIACALTDAYWRSVSLFERRIFRKPLHTFRHYSLGAPPPAEVERSYPEDRYVPVALTLPQAVARSNLEGSTGEPYPRKRHGRSLVT